MIGHHNKWFFPGFSVRLLSLKPRFEWNYMYKKCRQEEEEVHYCDRSIVYQYIRILALALQYFSTRVSTIEVGCFARTRSTSLLPCTLTEQEQFALSFCGSWSRKDHFRCFGEIINSVSHVVLSYLKHLTSAVMSNSFVRHHGSSAEP